MPNTEISQMGKGIRDSLPRSGFIIILFSRANIPPMHSHELLLAIIEQCLDKLYQVQIPQDLAVPGAWMAPMLATARNAASLPTSMMSPDVKALKITFCATKHHCFSNRNALAVRMITIYLLTR